MILDNRMPVFSCEDRQCMVDNTEQLMSRGDSQMDPGSTYHRRLKPKPWPKRVVPTRDVHRCFSNIWNPGPHPKEIFVPAKDDSPDTEDIMRLESSLAKHMTKGEAIKKCLNSKHNLSASGLEGIGYWERERNR
jgi:uncharacterized protein YoaH (UPF0181 family)